MGARTEREEDGSTDWRCGVALKELLVKVFWDGGDWPLLGGVCSKDWSKWLEEEEGGLDHLLREGGL